MPFKCAWKLSVVQAKQADEIISRVFEPIISPISKRLKMDTRRSDVFFSVGEAATSKWTHGEVAVFGSTVYKIYALKCQILRNECNRGYARSETYVCQQKVENRSKKDAL